MNESEGNTNNLGAKPQEQFKVSDDSTEIENPPIMLVLIFDKKLQEKNYSKRWKSRLFRRVR
jgi:hypothetical protein